ncbi:MULTISPECIES: DNA methyltransferase [unclassified Gordonia (in: high G+C Gram-positive bacteria)]|uniref:DNA methyltransferase n=1 Tax=unclassified Gordonia (in: high G+C Gram-positive bacteria) TaxID=2657482 RepID=UPI0019648244|nr:MULTISPECIES: DNA methyltransferase [unclassified Gordonia (in: high G+C Gram-positive bacteria)]MBN0974263.1 class I SAM-dependent DNA methyltransferase [Gordonia sp. BP-119]MBN0981913.1 class I SAM-dependent DNA methyltransferase [Gordonia sp. BP-94]
MARLNLKAVEERVAPLARRETYDHEFIFDLLLAYGKPKGNVTRLRNGSLNVAADKDREVAQKNVVYFRETDREPLVDVEELRTSPDVVRYNPRFVIATDYDELVAVDMKTGENKVFPIRDIDKHFTFFLPWAGMEKAQYTSEAHADVKAAERMGKLFDELLQANPDLIGEQHGRHALNVFFTRLLFCFFAEDTGIFDDGQFTTAVGSHTQADGSDVQEFLTDLFNALDTEKPEDKASYLSTFPYVNGRLFEVTKQHVVPAFTKTARGLLLDLGVLDWSEINPDIFGSMFQAIVTPGKRSDLGQHYTSVPNILKTIEPLFLDELKEEFDAGFNSVGRLEKLLERIGAIKVFDPACGSGNFLVIAYKELRRLEHAILERLADLSPKHQVLYAVSKIDIESFYGIEIDDFAVEVAILSLWIAKHQMNREFREKFGVEIPLIPLKEAGQIIADNAIKLDWFDFCPRDDSSEIYVLGNPPYLGSRNQSAEQKSDLATVTTKYKSLDYVSAWIIKGAEYIRRTSAQLAFVTTNSVTQGEQVGILWPQVLGEDLEIAYAYTSFKWSNHAKNAAGVTCVVVGLRKRSSTPKYLFTDEIRLEVQRINPYLADAPDIWIGRRSRPLSDMPRLGFGSMPNDGGNLILSDAERDDLLTRAPWLASYIKGFSGSDEFIKGKTRWCLVIPDDALEQAAEIQIIERRLAHVRAHRERSTEKSTKAKAATPNHFYFWAHQDSDSVIVPATSSERREYIPIGYLDSATVISNSANAAYDVEPWTFALLTSRTHMVWVRAVGGKMKTDYRYSGTIIYNNFPVPSLTDQVKERLTIAALRVLDVREYHCEKTLAELYDPDKMPGDLRAAHAEVDALVDSIYSKRGYETDEQRLSDLFAMHEEMTAAEQAAKPARRGKK